MIRIDQLRLSLPAGFERRGAAVAWLTAEILSRNGSRLSDLGDASYEHLDLGRLEVTPATGDYEIARRVAERLERALLAGAIQTPREGG